MSGSSMLTSSCAPAAAKKVPLLAALLMATAFTTPSIAAEPQTSGGAFAVEEILVFAQKRGAQSLQDVPMAISALSGDHLEATFAKDLESISFSMPNVVLDKLGPPGFANFAIRGLGSNSSIPSLDPAVGTFVDGIYLGTNAGTIHDFFDLESIEVLRGPQGVLQGKNVAGGAVMMRTRRPGQEFQVRSKLSINSFPGVIAASSVEGGLSDKLSGKMVGYFAKDDGWAKNITTGGDTGDIKTWFVRPALNYEGEGVNAFLTFEYGKQNGDAAVQKGIQTVAGLGGGKHETAQNLTCCLDVDWKQATLEVNGDVSLGDGTITSLTGWRDAQIYTVTDVDSGPTNGFVLTGDTDATQFSQELRYAGTFMDFWDVTAGLFYFQQDLTYFEPRDFGAIRTTFGGEVETESYAAFLNNSFRVMDTLTLNVGIRYTEEKKKAKIAPQGAPLSTATSSCNYDARTCVYTFSDSNKTTGWTPKFAIQWQPNDEILVYVSREEGLRSGGYNVRHTAPDVTPRVTDDEKVTTYELGGKFQLADGRVVLNTAAFYTEIDDILRDTVVFVDGVGFVQLNQNAGNAKVKGIEAEGTFSVTDELTINAAVGYLTNGWRDIVLDISGDGVIDQTDFDLILPRLAKWSVSIGGTYAVQLEDIGELALRANYSYRSRAPYPDNNTAFLPPANVLDASISWSPNDNITVSVFGKNLLNDEMFTSNTFAGAAFQNIAYMLPERQLGIELRTNF